MICSSQPLWPPAQPKGLMNKVESRSLSEVEGPEFGFKDYLSLRKREVCPFEESKAIEEMEITATNWGIENTNK